MAGSRSTPVCRSTRRLARRRIHGYASVGHPGAFPILSHSDDMTDRGDLLAGLARDDHLELKGDFSIPGGVYRVVSVRPTYVKVQKGSATPIQLTHAKLGRIGRRASAFGLPPGSEAG